MYDRLGSVHAVRLIHLLFPKDGPTLLDCMSSPTVRSGSPVIRDRPGMSAEQRVMRQSHYRPPSWKKGREQRFVRSTQRHYPSLILDSILSQSSSPFFLPSRIHDSIVGCATALLQYYCQNGGNDSKQKKRPLLAVSVMPFLNCIGSDRKHHVLQQQHSTRKCCRQDPCQL